MSGGVDSSVTALLLQQQGYHVEGLFMKNWRDDQDDDYCTAAEDLIDAQAVCAKLTIPLHTVSFADEYWDRVFEHFLQEYSAGRTPNPDILCNKEIKFKAFLDYATELGADFIATGHYARITSKDDSFYLGKGVDDNKDQSYFLYTLGQAQLSKSLFPIGDTKKSKVREVAAEAGLQNHAKKDSTGICFIGERKFKAFLQQYLPAQPGAIQTLEGDTIGEHEGLMYYTIGQRQGIGIGGMRNADEQPWYVVEKDVAQNILLVAQGNEHPCLFKEVLQAQQLTWVAGSAPNTPFRCTAKTRYRQDDQDCIITEMDDVSVTVEFDKPQRAITPGQSVVFYDGDICLGGGVIT